MAKAVRRDLRRAIGVGAIEHVQAQDQAVAILQNAVASCQREVATLAVGLLEQKQLVFLAQKREQDWQARTATFWQRLCWLFCE